MASSIACDGMRTIRRGNGHYDALLCSGTYLSREVSVFYHLVPKTFEQDLHVLLILLSTLSVQTLISECNISNHQSHTTGDGMFGPRIHLK